MSEAYPDREQYRNASPLRIMELGGKSMRNFEEEMKQEYRRIHGIFPVEPQNKQNNLHYIDWCTRMTLEFEKRYFGSYYYNLPKDHGQNFIEFLKEQKA